MPELSDSISESKENKNNPKVKLSDFKPIIGIKEYCDRCPRGIGDLEIINLFNKKEISYDQADAMIWYELDRKSNLGLLTLTHVTGLNIPIYLVGRLIS